MWIPVSQLPTEYDLPVLVWTPGERIRIAASQFVVRMTDATHWRHMPADPTPADIEKLEQERTQFEEWFITTRIAATEIQPIMIEALKDLAWKAWIARASNKE